MATQRDLQKQILEYRISLVKIIAKMNTALSSPGSVLHSEFGELKAQYNEIKALIKQRENDLKEAEK